MDLEESTERMTKKEKMQTRREKNKRKQYFMVFENLNKKRRIMLIIQQGKAKGRVTKGGAFRRYIAL